MAVVVVLCFGISIYTVVRQTQADAVRTADRKAQAASEVGNCYQQVENFPRTLLILNLIDGLATNSILANQQALKADPDSELTPTRKASLERLVPARESLRDVIGIAEAQKPTREKCEKMALELGVEAR